MKENSKEEKNVEEIVETNWIVRVKDAWMSINKLLKLAVAASIYLNYASFKFNRKFSIKGLKSFKML